MRRLIAGPLAVLLCAVGVGSVYAGQSAPAGAPFRSGTVEGPFSGPIEGPYEWSKGAKITTTDLTMVCDWFKVWPTKDGRGWERVEAKGHVVANGRYTAANGEQWKVVGRADSAVYDSQSAQAVLRGSVDFQATNVVTGAVVSVSADKLTYDAKTRQFSFEKGENQVKAELRQPPREEKPGAGAAQTGRGEPSK